MGAPAAVDVAVEALGPAAVMTAVPYLQPLALPAPTRRAWRSNKEVLDGLRAAIAHATGVEPAPLARLDRIRPRTAMSLVAFVVAFYVLLPQLGDFDDTVDAASRGQLVVARADDAGRGRHHRVRRAGVRGVGARADPVLPALRMQLASSFVSRIAPANTGTLAIGVRFLQRSGLDPGPPRPRRSGCTALSGFVVHLALMGGFLLWVGSSDVGFSLPRGRRDPSS